MRPSVAVLILVALAAVAHAQAPAGTEFQLNANTAGSQSGPAVAGLPGGRYLATWTGADADATGIVARPFDAAGAPLGPEFVVNQYTTSSQLSPSIAATPDGASLIVWTSNGQDGSEAGVFGRAYSAAARPLGPEFQISTFTTGAQDRPRVAAIPGGFLVVWQSAEQDFDGLGVFGRLVVLPGRPLTPEIELAAGTAGDQMEPVAAGMPDGGYVVAWRSPAAWPNNRVYMRRATPEGWTGPEVEVDTPPLGVAYAEYVAIASSPAGEFTVAWRAVEGFIGDGVAFWERGDLARRYDASGTPLGPPFRLDQAPSSWALQSALASGPGDQTLFAWTSSPGQFICIPPGLPMCEPPQVTQDGSGRAVYARGFAAGTPTSGGFRVNAYTTGDQQLPAVAYDPHGNALVVWQSPQDGSGDGIYGQRFGGLAPASLAVDPAPGPASDGNGVLEAGETAGVAPAWRNVTGASQTFSGFATGFGGPGGPTYGLADPLASYGTAANGATASCSTLGDCYVVSIVGARPLAHWDASLEESISPATLGQVAAWSLHVGDSFGDVPRTSPYYRFVETLLHHGVTGGCTASSYCPASPVTREQMAVFVLVGRESSAYAPPACTTPVFGDVPASSPFCRWIEELARRGVAGGCGGGNYCPASPVTREQMSVFLLRTLDPLLDPPACGTPVFGDVPASSPFCRWIEELARRGITGGCGAGNYCPTSPVTREQMAAFLSATFGLTLYGP